MRKVILIEGIKKRAVKSKLATDKSEKEVKKRKRKEVWVEFDLSEKVKLFNFVTLLTYTKENWKDVFSVTTSTARSNNHLKTPAKATVLNEAKQKHLLPIDLQVRPSRFLFQDELIN